MTHETKNQLTPQNKLYSHAIYAGMPHDTWIGGTRKGNTKSITTYPFKSSICHSIHHFYFSLLIRHH